MRRTQWKETTNKTIITVVGKDTVGIIAKVCTYLAKISINVLDISQTIVQGYFNMMMIVDMSTSEKPFADCAKELEQTRRRDWRIDQMPERRNF